MRGRFIVTEVSLLYRGRHRIDEVCFVSEDIPSLIGSIIDHYALGVGLDEVYTHSNGSVAINGKDEVSIVDFFIYKIGDSLDDTEIDYELSYYQDGVGNSSPYESYVILDESDESLVGYADTLEEAKSEAWSLSRNGYYTYLVCGTKDGSYDPDEDVVYRTSDNSWKI